MKKKVAMAWAPGNISCIFEICRGRTPERTGSRGMGFTVDEGATVSVSRAPATAVFYNNKKVDFPTVKLVIRRLTAKKVMVRISSDLPLGAGFGMSGASALAAAYAINRLLKLRKGRKELAMAAHCAEVEAGTGLGDVVNQSHGGLLVKFEPSWKFRVVRPKVEGARHVYCAWHGKMSTRNVLRNEKKERAINGAAEKALAMLREMLKKRMMERAPLPFAEIIGISKRFAEESGLLRDRKMKSLIAGIEKRRGHASMIMLGNAVFSDIPFPGSVRLRISEDKAKVIP